MRAAARLIFIPVAVVLVCSSVSATSFAKRSSRSSTSRSPAKPHSSPITVQGWFESYDSIRRRAQLSPPERAEADALLSKGLAIMTAGPDKDAAHALLQKMVANYEAATDQMSKLPVLQQTDGLRQGYYQYFSTAKDLFGDYLTVQNNFFAQDSNGRPVIQSLLQRKSQLEQINNYVHELDSKTRVQYNIPPYQY